MEKLKYKKLDVTPPSIKSQLEPPVGELTISHQSTRSFKMVIDLKYSLSFIREIEVKNNTVEGRGPYWREGAYSRGGLVNRGFTVPTNNRV